MLPSKSFSGEAKVYWFQKPQDEKDILIFDPGYIGGDIHIYEHKETMKAIKLDEQLKKHEHNMDWKIIQPYDPVSKKELEDALRRVFHNLSELQELLVRGLKNQG